jgi:hypothetical protein
VHIGNDGQAHALFSPALRAGLAARVGYTVRQQFAHDEQIVNHEHAVLLHFRIRRRVVIVTTDYRSAALSRQSDAVVVLPAWSLRCGGSPEFAVRCGGSPELAVRFAAVRTHRPDDRCHGVPVLAGDIAKSGRKCPVIPSTETIASNPVMAGLDPTILTRTYLAKDAIPISKHPIEMAGSNPAITELVQYVNSKGGWYHT